MASLRLAGILTVVLGVSGMLLLRGGSLQANDFNSGDSASSTPQLVWRGCGVSKKAFMEKCAVEYERQTGVKIKLSGGGAQLGIETAAAGGADLGGTCRACLSKLKEDELGIKLAVVAWDALTVIVHADNPVEDISREQLRDVLQQKLTNWKQLGGNDEEIIVTVRRGKTSGVGYSVRALILEDPEADFGATAVRLNSSGPLEQLVEKQHRAIGVTGISSARKRDVKTLSIDGQLPEPDKIAAGDYPYYRPLYIAYRPGINDQAQRFVDWLLSDAGQAVIEEQNTVTLRQGAELTRSYRHFGDISQISNYESLLEMATGAKGSDEESEVNKDREGSQSVSLEGARE